MNLQQRRHPPKPTARYDKAMSAARSSAMQPKDCEAEVRQLADKEVHPEGPWSRVIKALKVMREFDPECALFVVPRAGGQPRMRFMTAKVIPRELQKRIQQQCGVATGD